MYPSKNRNSLIQKIHIAKTQLRFDELSYRTMLTTIAGKESCADMTVPELVKILSHLESKGFKVRSKKRTDSSSTKVNSNITHKIRVIWAQMHQQGIVRDDSDRALNQFMRKTINQPHNKVLQLNVQSLDNAQATLVLERLKKWQQRELGGTR